MDKMKRISLLVGEAQHDEVSKRELNLSGLVRQLLDDFLNKNRIVLNVSKETFEIYSKITKSSGAIDKEIEPYFLKSLTELLKERIQEMQKLHKDLDETQK